MYPLVVSRVERAIDRAYACALQLPRPERNVSHRRERRVAIGDPQAPFATFLEILDRNGLLGDDGWLRPEAMLVTMGDHFDWGTLADAPKAADDALAMLAWLAHHHDDHVVLLAGNHDLGRVGELAAFDDEGFVAMRAQAALAYRGGDVDEDLQRTFLANYPELPTAELGARDFAAFRAQQRTLIAHLLATGRLRLAYAPHDHLLLVHAGVTAPQLRAVGIDPSSGARAIAAALDARLADAVRAWPGPPARLEVAGLHRPGDAKNGEGGGVLYHRAARDLEGSDRRYDPRQLPVGLAQAIGHVRDKKQRELLGPEWHDGAEPADGPIRHLTTNGAEVRYRRGLPDGIDPGVATVLYLDGGMKHAAPVDYELLDLDDPRVRTVKR